MEEKKLITMDALIEKPRFYLSTPKRIAEALIMIKETEKVLTAAKKKVKERATEILDESGKEIIEYEATNTDTGEMVKFEVRRMPAAVIKEYNPKAVINGLGERAFPFLKVVGGKLDYYLKRGSGMGAVSMQEIEKVKENLTTKHRKGSIQLREIKDKE